MSFCFHSQRNDGTRWRPTMIRLLSHYRPIKCNFILIDFSWCNTNDDKTIIYLFTNESDRSVPNSQNCLINQFLMNYLHSVLTNHPDIKILCLIVARQWLDSTDFLREFFIFFSSKNICTKVVVVVGTFIVNKHIGYIAYPSCSF